MRRRQKAQEVFIEHPPVFGTPGTFEQTFPQVEAVTVEIEEYGDGIYGGERSRRYTRESLAEYVNCSNPLCYNGGGSVGRILRQMIVGGETHLKKAQTCQGYEGSPKGRKKYRECLNRFDVTVVIAYKSSPPAGPGGESSA